jgi:hypothetical protein
MLLLLLHGNKNSLKDKKNIDDNMLQTCEEQ